MNEINVLIEIYMYIVVHFGVNKQKGKPTP